ncbi:hypothetical protein HK105_201425 [Polyrhizophydium stewartii]|uniref:L-2-hydroxyglutarate dehydrogenase, mitochondrial n=1 Tax=Polyrhizophydium stewartii TaxID=2732419 RepID=A0ABR4NI13_9FUNG
MRKLEALAVDHLVRGTQPALRRTSTLLVDKWPSFGSETSSRNSEVIHAGIYYADDSLKTRLCIRGRELLYELCRRERIPHANVGKWIVATSAEQAGDLDKLRRKAAGLGVPTHFIGQQEAAALEPNVRAHTVLVSPTTGIVDSHTYMQHLENTFADRGGVAAYGQTVVGLEKRGAGYRALLRGSDGTESAVEAATVVNAAGLGASAVASMLLPPSMTAHLKMHFCKGHYFAYSPSRKLVSRLVYPMPEKNVQSLGIHCTIDLAGKAKFGPDVLFIDNSSDYSIRDEDVEGLRQKFHEAVKAYMPGIRLEELRPDYTGIRPKLYGAGEPFRDFVIEVPDGYAGFVNLVGIESPGLTSSLAIAEHVETLL